MSTTLAVLVGGRPVDAFVGTPSHHLDCQLGSDSKTDKLECNLFLFIIGSGSLGWLIDGASGAVAAISCDN